MIQLLRDLRKKVVIGVVGGSDFVKVSEQLSVHGAKSESDIRDSLFHALSWNSPRGVRLRVR